MVASPSIRAGIPSQNEGWLPWEWIQTSRSQRRFFALLQQDSTGESGYCTHYIAHSLIAFALASNTKVKHNLPSQGPCSLSPGQSFFATSPSDPTHLLHPNARPANWARLSHQGRGVSRKGVREKADRSQRSPAPINPCRFRILLWSAAGSACDASLARPKLVSRSRSETRPSERV